jgi:glutaredoxin-like protein
MTENKIKFYGVVWCGDCTRSKRYLKQHEIAYDYIDVDEDAEGLEFVKSVNSGRRIVPTILFPDGDTLVEPTNVELGTKLGIISSA